MNMTRRIVFLALLVMSGIPDAPAILAQSPTSVKFATPQFDSVSISPCTSGEDSALRAGELVSPDSLRLVCRTVKSLIQEAFVGSGESLAEFGHRAVVQSNGGGHGSISVQTAAAGQHNLRLIQQPIVGGPEWLDSGLFTIEAKSGSPQSPETMTGPMLRGLLEAQFKLSVHRDARVVSAYVLTVAREGSRLKTAAEGSCDPNFWDHPLGAGLVQPSLSSTFAHPAAPQCGSFRKTGAHETEAFATMANLSDRFSALLNRRVIDRTGLAGLFVIRLPFSSEDLKPGPLAGELAGAGDPFRQLADAAQGLGLQLEAGNESSDVLVVDHVERPSVN